LQSAPAWATAAPTAAPTNETAVTTPGKNLTKDHVREGGPVPWIAAGLTLMPAAGFYVVTMLNNAQLANAVIPLMLGAGEWYAGDPWRALGVSAGGYGAIGVGALGGLGVGLAFPGGAAEMLGNVLNGGAVGLLAYSGWATYDAYRTAERGEPASLNGSLR
jgi:hypothetical protein